MLQKLLSNKKWTVVLKYNKYLITLEYKKLIYERKRWKVTLSDWENSKCCIQHKVSSFEILLRVQH